MVKSSLRRATAKVTRDPNHTMLRAAMIHRDTYSPVNTGPSSASMQIPKWQLNFVFSNTFFGITRFHMAYEIQAALASSYIPPKNRSYFRCVKSLT